MHSLVSALVLMMLTLGWSLPQALAAQVPFRLGGREAPKKPASGPTEAAPFIVVLDPGHGGRDAGSRGATLVEKAFTFSVARHLAKRLSKRPQIKVVMTRSGDTEVTPVQRAAVANYNGARLFVSLHADAAWRPGARMPVIIVAAPQRPPRVEGEPQEAVALRWQRGQNVNLADSRRFARGLQVRFAAIARGVKPPVHTLPLFVLEGARMPAIYISLGVITTPEEEARLKEMNAESPYIAAIAGEILKFAGLPETLPEKPKEDKPAAEKPAGEKPATASSPAPGAKSGNKTAEGR